MWAEGKDGSVQSVLFGGFPFLQPNSCSGVVKGSSISCMARFEWVSLGLAFLVFPPPSL